MAKINPVRVKQDADREEKAGRLEKAIGLYRHLVEDNPRDWNTIKKIGDLYARMSRNREATQEYAKVADFYARDGFLLKSIAIWKQITKLDPAALDPYLNLADLYAKQGLMMEAKSQYQIVVDEHIKRGKNRDAGDVLKKMAEIDPGDLKIRSKLADLYTREGNSGKAIEEHIAIAEELNKKGHLAEALQVLEKGLKIDPRSNRLRIELARVHLVQKNYDRAGHFLEEAVRQSPGDAQILSRLGEAYLGAKKMEEAEAIFKRLLELDPENRDYRTQMGRLYLLQGEFDRAFGEFAPVVDEHLERREGEKAAALLQQVVQRSSSHVPSLLKLVEVYRQLNKDSAVAQAYSHLTEAYINQGDWAQAASVLEDLVSMEPQHEQHRTKLEFVRGKLATGRPPAAPARSAATPSRPAAKPEAFSGPELVDEEFDLPSAELPSETEVPFPAPQAPRPSPEEERPRIELSPALSDEDCEFVEEHLAEGKVFRKYGLVDKAADQFESVVARFPDNVEARTELREVYKEKGQPAKAAAQCQALAEILRLMGDPGAARAHEQEAQQLMPPALAPTAQPPPPARAATPPRVAEPAAPLPAAGDEPDLVEEEIELETEAEEDVDLETEAEQDVDLETDGEEDIDLEVEESGLDASAEEPEVGQGLPGFELEEDAQADAELPARFIDEDFDEETALSAPAPVAGDTREADEVGSTFGEELDLEVAEEEPVLPGPDAAARVAAAALEPRPGGRPAPPSLVAPPRAPERSTPAGEALPAELQRVLDEVDSYLSLGFVDDAKDALLEVETRFPGQSALVRKMQEVGLAPEAPGSGAPREPEAAGDYERSRERLAVEELEAGTENGGPPPEPAVAAPPVYGPTETNPFGEAAAADDPLVDLRQEVAERPWSAAPPGPESLLDEGPPSADSFPPVDSEGGLDLGAELGELFGAQSAVEEAPLAGSSTEFGDSGLADIFKEFKKGVDKQLSKEDYDTRYNLGIAYKEMGLVDEAIAEFQLAAKDEGRILECSSMLGICFMEKGLPKLAVKWFEKGLKAPGRDDEEYQGLRYDLAMALEASGDRDKALSLFTDLYGQDANFRDVASKVRELRSALG